ncbi:DEAD/DEAH box helicase [Fimbriiglobus ruber]|uniref:Helicase, SNF2/RAD54 family n=1 Tax=Fimbriiglobus ruber TaxID=1908690 RepID=A0A225EDJ0_9BACT|nr:DEAD/DEAH box helicase [Fimbriiglobus ruber]OWK47379.1 Helicase, SNF2/RAD54 family [Fimbriiglobus ruber]
MIALQLLLRDKQFLAWGETTEPARAGRKSRQAARPHPFSVPAETIRTTVAESISSFQAPEETAAVWLPSTAGRPIASLPLIAEPPDPDAVIEMSPWAVPVLVLEAASALELLEACVDRDTLQPGVLIGPTLKYWVTAAQYAAGLVAREQFLPGLETVGTQTRACWRPVVGGPERPRFQRLAAAMPAACRATATDSAGGASPTAALNDFLELAVDGLVRSSRMTTTVRKTFASVHDQWLYALHAPDGAMQVSPAEAGELRRALDDWQRPIVVADAASYRLCFRLEEPPDATPVEATTKGTWTVRYLLQAFDDPSLLVSLDEAWFPHKAVARSVPLPSREFLFAALGQAAKLCPEVETSLNTAAPTEFTTDAGGAHRFLSETAYVLEQAGFGVLLPAWWARTGTKNRLAVTAAAKTAKKFSASNGVMSLDEVIKFDWKVAIGDTELSLAELEALARLKSPLVNVRGRWVQVNADEIRTALDFWTKNPQTTGTVRDLLKMSLGAETGPGGLAVRGVKTTGGLKVFLDQLRGTTTFAELTPPRDFHGTLRPYQVRGYSWLSFLRRVGLGACLADDMGLGKSVQTLAAIQQAREDGETRPVLLVCPTSVVGHWRKEAERFTPTLSVLIHHGQKRTKGEKTLAAQVKQFGLVVSSFSLLHRDAAALQAIPWAGVILDEAQNIKNPDAKTSQAARALKADFRVALTGTPVENHVGDLWSIGQYLNPGFLGSRESFRRNFLVPIQMHRDEDATRRLKDLTGPFLLRRLKTDKSIIADLPDKFEANVFCTLTKEQATLYQAVVRELDKSLKDEDGIRRKGLILGALSKLKQVCNHPAQFLGDNSAIPDRSGKLARLTEMIDEVLQVGDRALIFTQFTEMGDIIRKHLQETFGKEVLFLHGGVPQKNRERMVARFQDTTAADAPRVFLISLKAGGTGVTLTAANHVFHFDRWWNPAVENQATDRAFRIGQTRNVQVHKFVCVGTLEEKIDEMIERKKEVAGRVVGTGEGWLTEMSNTELKDLLALRADAVEE